MGVGKMGVGKTGVGETRIGKMALTPMEHLWMVLYCVCKMKSYFINESKHVATGGTLSVSLIIKC